MPASLHLVIPCFHESARIGPFLADLKSTFAGDDRIRIRVVDDGSGAEEQDRLSAVLAPILADCPLFYPLLRLPENLGKGGAVYAGWDQAGSVDWLAFVDADGSCPASEVKRLMELALLQPVSKAPAAIFASRVKMLGRQVDRHFKRHLIGRVFATLVSELLFIPVYDSQCGLKLIPRAAYTEVRPRLTLTGFAFDVDLLVRLLDAGHAVREEPIDWHETPGGKVRLLRDSWSMARDVLRIRGCR